MQAFVIEIKPYANDETTVYLTNSYELAKEASKAAWVPVFSLKETVYPTLLSNMTDEEYNAQTYVRELYMYKTVDDDYLDDYLEAFDVLKRTHNIEFVEQEDQEAYITYIEYVKNKRN
jgi:hypothetical protein